MSDRNYTYLTKVTGPNADSAREAANAALTDLSKDECGWDFYHGSWDAAKKEYFDHKSGEGAIITVALASKQFASETFHLFVNGGMAEGRQGPVAITGGQVTDGRCDAISYGEEPTAEDTCVYQIDDYINSDLFKEKQAAWDKYVRETPAIDKTVGWSAEQIAHYESLPSVDASDISMEDVLGKGVPRK